MSVKLTRQYYKILLKHITTLQQNNNVAHNNKTYRRHYNT